MSIPVSPKLIQQKSPENSTSETIPKNFRETSISFLLPNSLKIELDHLPNLDLNLLQTEIKEEKIQRETEKTQLVSNNPLHPPKGTLNIDKELSWFLGSGVLLPNKYISPEDHNIIIKILQKKNSKELFKKIFWLVHYIKFQPENQDLILSLRKNVAQVYPKYVKETEVFEEELKNALLFVFGYLVHSLHFRIYSDYREKFDIRFILDSYHIIVFELTGVLVSDYYVHSQVEKIFEDRFFFYKQEGALKLTKIDPYEGLEFYKHYRGSKDEYHSFKRNNNFDTEDTQIAKQLFTKLEKRFSSILSNKPTMTNVLMNRMTSQLAKELIELSHKQNSDEIIRKKRDMLKVNRILNKKMKLKKPLYQDDAVIENKEEQNFLLKAKSYLKQRLPRLKKKFKFDCTQISPPLRDIIGSSGKPLRKKTISISSYQVSDFNAEDLERLYDQFGRDKGVKRRKKNIGIKGMFRKKTKKKKVVAKQSERAKRFMEEGEGVDDHLKVKFLDFFKVQEVIF